jgi:DNA-binding MurR/RpiR family transcriptional regulator
MTRRLLGDLSAGERKVARALLAAYPVAGLETVAQLAERANVSPPTVVRFVSRLGFGGFPHMQRALMREVHERMGSPLEQYPEPKGTGPAASSPAAEHAEVAKLTQLITDTFREVPASELAAARDLLADLRRTVVITAGRFSASVAELLNFHLRLLRDDVHLVPADGREAAGLVAATGRNHVLVTFDFRRYDRRTANLARAMSDRGADLVLFTDAWLSPIAHLADVVLPAQIETRAGFDSLVAASGLVEHVIGAVAQELGERGRDRVAELERINQQLDATPS